MTCKQLYGPCDAMIQGATADEMIANSQKHAMEMVANGDALHVTAINAMRKQYELMTPEEKQMWMEKFQQAFALCPDD